MQLKQAYAVMAEEPMEQAQASTSAAEEEEWHGVSLAILQAVKTAQNQHGLRHGDHKRYKCVKEGWTTS